MGFFDESICDCCVCPMQYVLEQLAGKEVDIRFVSGNPVLTNLNDVENFIAFTDQGDFPICNIVAARIEEFITINLIPIKKSIGECGCCEDPMTNLANSLERQTVVVEIINSGVTNELLIVDVGEGIIIFRTLDATTQMIAVSSCFITRIIPQ